MEVLSLTKNIVSYLRFGLQELTYALPISVVKEIFFLPELTPIPDSPGDIIGILNLRGQILPIMHLAKRLGRHHPVCAITDNVIVVELLGLQVGVIVHRVEEVIDIYPDQIEPEPDYGRINPRTTAFLQGIARSGEELIMLMNPEALVRLPESLSALSQIDPTLIIPGDFYTIYFPTASPKERLILHQRMIALIQSKDDQEQDRTLNLAIVQLENEFIGIPLEEVREFIDIPTYVPIPCCPDHIVGNMNLRGEIMTLIDVCPILQISRGDRQRPGDPQAVVVEVEDMVAGIIVDEVEDVVEIPSSQLNLQSLLGADAQDLLGIVMYEGRMVKVLNTRQLFLGNRLVVEAA